MKLFIKKNLLEILTFIPLILALISLNFLPNTIPMHWGFNGNVDTFGSKYIILVLPIIAIVVLSLYALRSRLGTATENKYAITTTLVILNIIMCLVITVTFKSISSSAELNTSNISTLFMGIVFIITGNYMPKIKRNGIIGIKTPWTIGSDEVWYKTHRIGGKITVVCGIVMIIISLLVKRLTLVPILGIVILDYLIATIYSYSVVRRY